MKFTVKRDESGTTHTVEFDARNWEARSVVSREAAADRSWVIGAQRYLKTNWPKGLTGPKLVAELVRLARDVFVYGGPSKAPISAAGAGVKETDTVAEALAKLRAAGVNITI